jgi:eukaryotic-like serine/threonine-protein kinase
LALSAGTRLGPYEIVDAIGAGGMGEVYQARDTRLNRSVAIKVLPPDLSGDPERKARFEREAHTLAALSHPHICTLFDVGEHDGSMFLVMELLQGDTLAQRLERGALPLPQALEIAVQIAEGLDAAHKRGIVHRDLKPGNVVLTRTGATLLDFGLAKLRGHGEKPALVMQGYAPTEADPLTRAGAIMGTLQYMAPEQIQGRDADALGTVGVDLIGSVVNVLSTEQAIWVCEDINGCGDYAFTDATDWQRPRRFELGFRIEF